MGDGPYRRVLLKISGEALSGDQDMGICPKVLGHLVEEISRAHAIGTQMAIVIGGGNIFRGVSGTTLGMDRTASDHMGMLATIINSLAFQDGLERKGLPTRVMSAIDVREVCGPYIRRKAMGHLEKGRIVIFAAGTGNPYFTTDTAAALRASEIDAEIIMKATKVDGVYDCDPATNKGAKKFQSLTYLEALNRKEVQVMDSTALSLCMDNNLDILVFNIFSKGNILRAIKGEQVGTRVCN